MGGWVIYSYAIALLFFLSTSLLLHCYSPTLNPEHNHIIPDSKFSHSTNDSISSQPNLLTSCLTNSWIPFYALTLLRQSPLPPHIFLRIFFKLQYISHSDFFTGSKCSWTIWKNSVANITKKLNEFWTEWK